MELSEGEKALYAELVVQIAARMGDLSSVKEDAARTDRFDFEARVIEHGFEGSHEDGCSVLLGLGAVRPLNADFSFHEDETVWSYYFRITLSAPALRNRLKQALPSSAPPLTEVIQAFLALATDYGCDIPVHRKPFRVPADFEPAFDLLEKCGYVARNGTDFSWVDKIAPEMRTNHDWNDEGVPYGDLYETSVEKMWRTMPPRFREMFFSGGPVDILSLAVVISRFWYRGDWQETDRHAGNPEIIMADDAVSRARKLEEKFRESSGG